MPSPLQNNGIPDGQYRAQAAEGGWNAYVFGFQQLFALYQTATIVKVIDCSNDGGLSPVGTVTIQPLVNQIDGNGNGFEHGQIFNVPYFRLQGGTDAIILDPKPGDLGIALFASRDISNVKVTKAQANPGSYRMYDWADGMYLGGLLNGTPQQYVRFTASAVEIVSPTKITLTAPIVEINGDATISQTLSVTEDVIAGPEGEEISLRTHLHTSAAAGQPTSEPLPL